MTEYFKIPLFFRGQNRQFYGWKTPQGYTGLLQAQQFTPDNGSIAYVESQFDKDGNLKSVTPYAHSSESGPYKIDWENKNDSIYNAAAAKEYAPVLFQKAKPAKKYDGGGINYLTYVGDSIPVRKIDNDAKSRLIDTYGLKSVDENRYFDAYRDLESQNLTDQQRSEIMRRRFNLQGQIGVNDFNDWRNWFKDREYNKALLASRQVKHDNQ